MNQSKGLRISLCLFAVTFFVGQFFAVDVSAAIAGSITGFAWAGNNNDGGVNSPSSIGWISFSSKNCDTNGNGSIDAGDTGPTGCPTVVGTPVANYGVTLTDDGNNSTATLSGYAWSASLGWISFNQGDLTGCPTGTCIAQIDTTCPSNKCNFSGWAKVLSVNAGNAGGWDGWIHLAGSDYGVYADMDSKELAGYASSDWTDPATGTVGWIKFTGMGAKTDYEFLIAPVAKMACDAANCPGTKVVCGCDAGGNNCAADWVMYQPVATPACNFQLKNFSTGIIDTSEWSIGASNTRTCTGADAKCDYGTVQSNIGVGDYIVSLTVANAIGQDTATHSLKILNDVHAGFMCSLNEHNWQACSSPSFVRSASKGEKVYFKDDQLLADVGTNYSWPSDGETIVSRDWSFNGVSINSVDENNVAQVNGTEAFGTVTLQKNNTVTLLIRDSNGRIDTVTYQLDASFVPKWQEISPIGAAWKNLLAGAFGIMNNVTR